MSPYEWVSIGIAILALFIAFGANRKAGSANNLSEKANYEAKRPRLNLTNLSIDPKNVEVYAGEHVEWENTEPLVCPNGSYDFAKIISDEDNVKKCTRWDYNGKKYLLVNLCPANVNERIGDVVLMLGALNITIDLGSDRISCFRLGECFSLVDGVSLGDEIKTNVEYITPKSPLEMQVAYACINYKTKSLKLDNILNLKNSYDASIKDVEDTQEIENLHKASIVDFLNPLNDIVKCEIADKYISFSETGYVLKCTTNIDYDYTLYMEKKKNGLENLLIHDTIDVFVEKVNGRDIVQQSTLE